LSEFYQICKLAAVGDEGELIRFEVNRSKVKVTAGSHMVK